MMTRAAGRRARSQSKEPQITNPKASKTGVQPNNLEAVAEDPRATNGTQKSTRTESSMSFNFSPTSSQDGRPTSPISLSRAQEKTELQNLNDRLAVVLRTLKESQEENQQLKVQLKVVVKEAITELEDELEQYKLELEKARIALDVENGDKVREVLAREKIEVELHECQKELQKDNKRMVEMEKRCRDSEKQCREVKKDLDEAEALISELQNTKTALMNDISDVKRQLAEAQRALERETVERAETENKLRTALEKAQFEASVADKKVARQSLSMVDGQISTTRRASTDVDMAVYMDMFRDELEEAKADIEEKLETKYAKQINSLQSLCASQQSNMAVLHTTVDTFRKDHKDDQKTIGVLQKRVRELEDEMDRQRVKFEDATDKNLERTESLNEQNVELTSKYNSLLDEYRKLQNANLGMAQELATYNSLLTTEETRLGIASPEPESTYDGRPLKRKRIDITPISLQRSGSQVVRSTVKKTTKSQASGAVRILEVNPGKVVRLENNGTVNIDVGKWQVKQKSGSEEIVYEFEPDHSITGHSIISIYSSTENHVPHDGVTEIVWNQAWNSSDSVKTVLINAEGVEVASCESVVDQNGHNSPESSGNRSVGFLGRIFGRT